MDEQGGGVVAETGDVLGRLPPEVLQALTADQLELLRALAKPTGWRRHPINLRLTLPFVGHRMFLTIVGGEEHRGAERLQHERERHPLFTLGNFLFLSVFLVVWAVLGLAGLAMWSRGFPLIDPTIKRAGGPS